MMASRKLRLAHNAPGEFFVDSTCIDCDACRQIAPAIFRERNEQSIVYHQPETDAERLRAQMALVACPTGSIGAERKQDLGQAIRAYPDRIAENVYFCGFTSESSFGAWSYLIQRPEGNVMVDSPRFARQLVKRIEEMGGVSLMFLTHRDDVADHRHWAEHFGCKRVIHCDDVTSGTRSVETRIQGAEAVRLGEDGKASDLVAIPTPGHTRGHMVLLYRDKFLFTGDHLAWSEERRTLYAFRNHCWYSWQEQIRSMERLLEYRFEWVLPGHGRMHHAGAQQMWQELLQCVQWMKKLSR